MPIFHLTAIDKDNSLEIRLETRPKHIEYLNSLGDKLLMAGPILDDNQKPKGTIAIINADDYDNAITIFSNDPYVDVGLFANTEIVQINPLFGKYL